MNHSIIPKSGREESLAPASRDQQQPNVRSLITQKKGNLTSVAQRVKFAELSAEDTAIVKATFGNYLRNNVAQFNGMKLADILSEIKLDKDHPALNDWLTAFKATQSAPKENPFASASSSAMIEKPLPATQEAKGTHVSFATNVKSGIDGMFDLWYYHRLNTLDVDVKFGFTGAPSREEYLTLKSMEQFWTNQFSFRNKRNPKTTIRIDINILPVPILGPYHFRYQTVSQGVNPNVLRAGQQFSSRTTTDDAGSAAGERQVSAHHEFGHVLGLGEEYDLKDHARRPGHHFEMARAAGIPPPEISEDRETVPGSVMGKGNILQPQHYAGILISFANLIGSAPSDWEIVKID